jgi:FkbM family methyltransferase
MSVKDKMRSLLNYVHLDITQNLKYDRLTKKIIKENLLSDSNCIDIGCHKGEILEILLSQSPNGTHFAFEPLPTFYNELVKKFNNKATIFPFALSDKSGETEFHFVKNAPAYSGIQKRKYAVQDPDIEKLKVEVKRLDEVIPENVKIDFIKIDVEGGEFDVLKGGKRLLENHKPLLIFEFGKGASDFYNVQPSELFQILADLNYSIYTLDNFVNRNPSFSMDNFEKAYEKNKEYYFVAKVSSST